MVEHYLAAEACKEHKHLSCNVPGTTSHVLGQDKFDPAVLWDTAWQAEAYADLHSSAGSYEKSPLTLHCILPGGSGP